MTKVNRYGEFLEHLGWLQGAVVTDAHAHAIINNASNSIEIFSPKLLSEDFVLITASQSCNIANDDMDLGPHVEFSVGRLITRIDGNYSYNKNPRKLHTSYNEATDEGVVLRNIEILSKESIFIAKESLVTSNILFNKNAQFGYHEIDSYVAWLSGHYNKPALPTAFNNRLIETDRKDKRKAKAKSLSPLLSGIYVEINPFKELPPDEHYSVNLLGLLPVGNNEAEIISATKTMETFADLMRSATMNVKLVVTTEDKITVARLRNFKRFYYDDLSYREVSHPLPPE
ncbi:hypothetical protein K8B83_00875 [Shewanella inventionis]|uniref:hypothetical protein n=1 Tax=Shewanella inventionis TaxID=1738770 RepID=UPI001CBB7E7A|nr:hypothetical protein [Shewanella inventionis]UAL43481.1 hypothetical protein K8B83_00875 [Shewanella inventionis]